MGSATQAGRPKNHEQARTLPDKPLAAGHLRVGQHRRGLQERSSLSMLSMTTACIPCNSTTLSLRSAKFQVGGAARLLLHLLKVA